MRRAAVVGALAVLGAAAWPGPFVSSQTPQTARDATTGPPQGTSAIGGTVVAADTGRPVRYARVALTGVDTRGVRTTSTDAQGRFTIPGLNAGLYTLSVAKPGMLDVIFGQRRPGSGRPGTPIQINANQRLDDVALKMARGGVITGTVIDELGEPMFGVSVRALRFILRNGVRTLTSAGSSTTDDRGMYRIAALLPGEYAVTAVPSASAEQMLEVEVMKAKAEAMAMEVAAAARAGASASIEKALVEQQRELADRIAHVNITGDPTDAYVSVFHPGSSSANAAATITLDISEERSAVDMQVQRRPVGRISGTLSSADGSLPPSAQLQLIEANQTYPSLTLKGTRSAPDGKFSFPPVPPGQYTIIATAMMKSGEPAAPPALLPSNAPLERMIEERMRVAAASTPYWAIAEVSTNGQPITGVSLTLQRGMTISGQVVVADSPTPVDMRRLTLTVTSVNPPIPVEMPSPPPAVVDAQGRFTIKGVIPGTYRVVPATGLAGLTLKSSVFDGRDSLDFPLVVKPGDDVAGGVVTFTSRAGEVSGRLQESTGTATSDFTIVLFPSDQRFWSPGARRIQATRPATDGRFSFRSLPAGDYRLVAVSDIETGQWFDPAFLRPLAAASIPLTLGEGEQKVQDIRIR
jgi:protocatechuate 3,4-dioxygenase beta subunit